MALLSWKIADFPKIWPLTSHNWVKLWPTVKKRANNREYSSRAIRWYFPLSSTTLSLEMPSGEGVSPPPLCRWGWWNGECRRGGSPATFHWGWAEGGCFTPSPSNFQTTWQNEAREAAIESSQRGDSDVVLKFSLECQNMSNFVSGQVEGQNWLFSPYRLPNQIRDSWEPKLCQSATWDMTKV